MEIDPTQTENIEADIIKARLESAEGEELDVFDAYDEGSLDETGEDSSEQTTEEFVAPGADDSTPLAPTEEHQVLDSHALEETAKPENRANRRLLGAFAASAGAFAIAVSSLAMNSQKEDEAKAIQPVSGMIIAEKLDNKAFPPLLDSASELPHAIVDETQSKGMQNHQPEADSGSINSNAHDTVAPPKPETSPDEEDPKEDNSSVDTDKQPALPEQNTESEGQPPQPESEPAKPPLSAEYPAQQPTGPAANDSAEPVADDNPTVGK